VHRVADVVQIPCPWIRSDQREYRRQPRPHSPSFPCDPRLCNDSRARCAATIFLYSPFSVFSSLRFVSHLYPSSSSIPTIIAHPCPHRSSSPSPSPSPPPHHVNAPMFDANTPASTLLPVPICAFSNPRDRGLSPSPSLSVTWGTSPNSARRHRSALQFLCSSFS